MSVEGFAAFSFVDGGESIGSEGAGVVAGGDEKVAIAAEANGAAVVTTLVSLFVDFENVDTAGVIEFVTSDGEPAQDLPLEIDRGVVKVDPLVVFEIWIESHSDQPVFLIVGDDDFTQGRERF